MMGLAEILIIESDAMVALDLQRSLHALGHSAPVVVPTGEDAVRTALERPPSLVLSEVSLEGGISGIEAVEVIRSRHDVPIVYMTADSGQKTAESVNKSHHYGCLLKPFTVGQLKRAVEAAVRTWRNEVVPRMERIEQWASFNVAVEEQGNVCEEQAPDRFVAGTIRIDSGGGCSGSEGSETNRFIVPSCCLDSTKEKSSRLSNIAESRSTLDAESEMRIHCTGLDEVRFATDGSSYRVPRLFVKAGHEGSTSDDDKAGEMPEADDTMQVMEILREEIERLTVQGEDLHGILELAIGISEGRYPERERERIVIGLVAEVGYFPQYDSMSVKELQEFRRHLQGES
jgi:CheY-like chemotaxis protein